MEWARPFNSLIVKGLDRTHYLLVNRQKYKRIQQRFAINHPLNHKSNELIVF